MENLFSILKEGSTKSSEEASGGKEDIFAKSGKVARSPPGPQVKGVVGSKKRTPRPKRVSNRVRTPHQNLTRQLDFIRLLLVSPPAAARSNSGCFQPTPR